MVWSCARNGVMKFAVGVLACGLVLGVSGCGQSIYSQDVAAEKTSASSTQKEDPDRIHANHDRGVDPRTKWSQLKGEGEFKKFKTELEKWGVKQTSDWLEICNEVNVPALRQAGLDPQKNLRNRQGGDLENACTWWTAGNGKHFLFLKTDQSLEYANTRPQFILEKEVHRGGQTYFMGKIDYTTGKVTGRKFNCAVNYERDGWVYAAAFTGEDNLTDAEACEDLVAMVSPRT